MFLDTVFDLDIDVTKKKLQIVQYVRVIESFYNDQYENYKASAQSKIKKLKRLNSKGADKVD